jgi:hypothetical protein
VASILGRAIGPADRPRRRSSARPGHRFSARVTVAVALTLVSYLVTGCAKDGKALNLGDGGSEISLAVDVGDSVTYGYNIIRNTTTHDVALVAAELIPDGQTSGAKIIEIRASGMAGSSPGVGIVRGYPPRQLEDSWGTTVLAKDRTLRGGADEPVALLFGVAITQPGTWRFKGVRIAYRMSGRRFVQEVDSALRLCSCAEIALFATVPADPQDCRKFDDRKAPPPGTAFADGGG